jgi:hypothetical protein
MPDLPNRSKHEREVAVGVLALFESQQDAYENGRPLPSMPPEALIVALAAIAIVASTGLSASYNVPIEMIATRSRLWADRFGTVLADEITRTSEEYRRGGGTIEEWRGTWKSRAEGIGTTETTRTVSAAEEDAIRWIEEMTGKVLNGTWYTENDARVCEMCGPLHATGPEVYSVVSESGPPAHPRCRCWLEYEEV